MGDNMAKTFKELAEEMRRHAEAKTAADEALAAAVQRVEEEADNRRLDRSIRQVWQDRVDAESGESLDSFLKPDSFGGTTRGGTTYWTL